MLSATFKNKNNLIILILFLCWVVGFIDKAAINIAIIPISADFGLGSEQTGMVISGFFLAYSLTQLIGGYLVDRMGSKTILTGAVALWSVATAMGGMASSVFTLAVTRFLSEWGKRFSLQEAPLSSPKGLKEAKWRALNHFCNLAHRSGSPLARWSYLR